MSSCRLSFVTELSGDLYQYVYSIVFELRYICIIIIYIYVCLFLGFFRARWKWRTYASGDTHSRSNLPKERHRTCCTSLFLPHSQ